MVFFNFANWKSQKFSKVLTFSTILAKQFADFKAGKRATPRKNGVAIGLPNFVRIDDITRAWLLIFGPKQRPYTG